MPGGFSGRFPGSIFGSFLGGFPGDSADFMPALMQLVSFSTFRPVSQWICFCFWLAASGCRVYMQNFSTALHACRVYIQKFSAALHGCRMKIKKILGRLMVCGCICRTSLQHSLAAAEYEEYLRDISCFSGVYAKLLHSTPWLPGVYAKVLCSTPCFSEKTWSAAENFLIYTQILME